MDEKWQNFMASLQNDAERQFATQWHLVCGGCLDNWRPSEHKSVPLERQAEISHRVVLGFC